MFALFISGRSNSKFARTSRTPSRLVRGNLELLPNKPVIRPQCVQPLRPNFLPALAKTLARRSRRSMLKHFPQPVPEILVSNVEKATEYYVRVLGLRFDWGNDEGGIGEGGLSDVSDERVVPPKLCDGRTGYDLVESGEQRRSRRTVPPLAVLWDSRKDRFLFRDAPQTGEPHTLGASLQLSGAEAPLHTPRGVAAPTRKACAASSCALPTRVRLR
jgi:catechol 2,3-dioxygenase-like lactoylglutathione lyase family enzyme